MKDRIQTTSLVVIALAQVLVVLIAIWWAFGLDAVVARMPKLGQVTRGEIETTKIETSIHLRGEAGEIKNFTLRPGIYEILSGADLITITSLNDGASSSWTGFSRVLSVVDRDYWEYGRKYASTIPSGPVELTVSGEHAWVVDILRIWTPADVKAEAEKNSQG